MRGIYDSEVRVIGDQAGQMNGTSTDDEDNR